MNIGDTVNILNQSGIPIEHGNVEIMDEATNMVLVKCNGYVSWYEREAISIKK